MQSGKIPQKVAPLSPQKKLQALDGKSTVTSFKLGLEQPKKHGCALYFRYPVVAGAVDEMEFRSSTEMEHSALLVEVSGIDLMLESIKAGKDFAGQILLFDCEVIQNSAKAGTNFKITGPGGVTQSVPATSGGQHLLFVLTVTDGGAASFEISCDATWDFNSCEVTLAK